MMKLGLRGRILISVALSALTANGAFAAETTDAKIKALEQQLELLKQQVQDLKASQTSKFAETKRVIDEQPKVSIENGRPTFKTADGNFSASLRSLVQFDSAYYIQDNAPAGSDLSSGTNFRRARIGIEGTLGKSWEYSFIYDFGGSGVEAATISNAYIQYIGLKPFTFRAGAFAPYANLEDSGGAGDTLFLERATVTEIARSTAGGDGRSAFSITAAGERYFGSVAYTGARVGQSGFFDEQQALVGRAAGLFYTNANTKVVLGANGTYVFDTSDVAAGPGSASTGINFQNAPELRVDNTSLVSTGNINADSVTQWGVDGAAQWKSLYGEGGYFSFSADRRGSGLAGSNPEFTGWYAQASWLLTGESRRYDATRAAFRSPKVANPVTFGPGSGWGAWELAARYSTIDLNFDSALSTANGGIRGGEQDVYTLGVNFYPNNAVRLSLNYLLIDVNRRNQGTTAPFADIGQDVQAIAARTQVNF